MSSISPWGLCLRYLVTEVYEQCHLVMAYWSLTLAIVLNMLVMEDIYNFVSGSI